jgi:hypothetical protein
MPNVPQLGIIMLLLQNVCPRRRWWVLWGRGRVEKDGEKEGKEM